jgi:tRNA uridine 5-carboxymethylaminomethyl modification enzyme
MLPSARVNALLQECGTEPLTQPALAADLLKRPQLTYGDVIRLLGDTPGLSAAVIEQVEIHLKYEGYIRRQLEQVARMEQMEDMPLPEAADYWSVPGLSHEICEKLTHIRPTSLGQAARISGVTPAAVAILMVYFQKRRGPRDQHAPALHPAPESAV